MDANRIEKWASRLLVFLALGSFILSFFGMYAVAAEAGYGWLTFLWPLVSESAVVIFSFLYLVTKLNGYENRYLMPLIVGCTILSVILNILHAPKSDFLTRTVVAIPPVFLFAAFKAWIWKIEQDTKRQGIVTTINKLTKERDRLQGEINDKTAEYDKTIRDKQAELDAKMSQVAELDNRVDELVSQIHALEIRQKSVTNTHLSLGIDKASEARAIKLEQRRQDVLSLLNEGLSTDDIAAQLGVSLRTVQRDITALNGQVRVAK
jgi:hypothetical protein